MPSFSTLQPNTAVDLIVRSAVSLNATPGQITTTANRNVFFYRCANTPNNAKGYAKFWNSGSVPTQDATAPDMILPVPPLKTLKVSFVEGHLGTFWSAGIFTNVTSTRESANTSNAIQANPATAVNIAVEHGA